MLGDQPVKTGFGLFSKFKGNYDELFCQISPLMRSFDFIIGNFEGVLVKDIGEISPDTSAMKVPFLALSSLKKIGIKVLSVANNHTMEYGPHAFYKMCQYFNKNGIITVGNKKRPYDIIECDNLRIAVLAFSTIPSMYGYEPLYFFVDYRKEILIRQLLEHVKDAKANSDYLIVLPHWGYEFVEIPTKDQYELAEKIILNGADCIVGAHPHVIQKAFIINNKPVVFSAGNFISDYWQERIKKNLLVELNIENKQVLSHELIIDKNFFVTYKNKIRPFDKEVNYLNSYTESTKLINRERNRVRKEVIIHLFTNWFELVKNYKIILWLLSRFLFIIKNLKRLSEDPSKIYE